MSPRKHSTLIVLVLAALLPASGFAQHAPGHAHGAAPETPATGAAHSHPAPAAGEEWVDGEVRRVDREQNRMTIRHGEIRSLDMAPMTMVFDAANPAMLDGLSPGDRIRFRVIAEGGRYRLTAVERP